jgi:CHAT domain-containing protein
MQHRDVAEEYAERGFSFSRLPYTREEVLGISMLYSPNQRKVYLGERAREETVKTENLEDYRYIHFASHAVVDEIHSLRSGILFSRGSLSTEDGVLQMGEIMRLKLNAGLGDTIRLQHRPGQAGEWRRDPRFDSCVFLRR